METYEDAKRFGSMAPKLTNEDILSVNKAFPSYLFRRRKTREVWTSCCLRHEVIPKDGMTEEMRRVMEADHSPEVRGYCSHAVRLRSYVAAACPWCGKIGQVKELGRCGKRDNLAAFRRAVVFKWHEGALWALPCHTRKIYGGGDWGLTLKPEVQQSGAYRFEPGRAERALISYGTGEWCRHTVFGLWHLKKKGTFPEPFGYSTEMGVGYDLVCTEEIDKSPLRWCQPMVYAANTYSLMRFLALCTVYPRQVEFLMKAGMWEVVRDLAEYGKTNKAAIDWTKVDPREAFGLNSVEIRTFLSSGCCLPVLTAYKRGKKRGAVSSMDDWTWLRKELGYDGLFLELASKIYGAGLTVEKWRRYIQREYAAAKPETAGHSVPLRTVIIWWRDYINAAKALGYNLKNPVFLLPKGLPDKHDEATAAAQRILAAQQDAKNAEKERIRRRGLVKRYGYSDGRYLIRPPIGAAEIVAEGKSLKHCVGGYAQRHVNGSCTILFLRDRLEPGKPLVTIEMKENGIVQAHGWDDERSACKKNPKRIPPRQLYADFLDPWLAWLAAGSKRDKRGAPVLPKKKEKEGAA